jgi:hypothetical protein
MTITNVTDYKAFEQALISWLEGTAGLETGSVRFLNQASVRPPLPYGTLQIVSDGRLEGHDSEEFVRNTSTEALDAVLSGPRRMTIQVTLYTERGREDIEGRSARERLNGALTALRHTSVRESLRAAGLAYLQTLSAPTADDDQTGDRWERRMRADVEFGYAAASTETSGAGWIETVSPITEEDGTLIIQS